MIDSYQEALEYISAIPMFQNVGVTAYNPSLTNIQTLCSELGNPQDSFKVVHIAGTNGKGSTSHLIASTLYESGMKVGLYTSPHLVDFRERIKVNGVMIEKDFILSFIKNNISLIERIHPSFFELTTIMAFEYFKQSKVDIAVIEAGLGGRLDATNVVEPIISVITNISYDHTSVLGNKLQDIAKEKAGIIKENIPVLIGEWQNDTAMEFISTAKYKSAPITFADKRYVIESNSITNGLLNLSLLSLLTDDKFNISCDLIGEYQKKNIITALCALDIIYDYYGLKIEMNSLRIGFENCCKNTGFAGRWQKISEYPLIVCDTGHNLAGIEFVVKELRKNNSKNIYVVLGFVSDKDVDKIIPLFPKEYYYIFTQSSVSRALGCEELFNIGVKWGLKGECISNVAMAIEKAKDMAKEDDMIFIGGSTYTVADGLKYFDGCKY